MTCCYTMLFSASVVLLNIFMINENNAAKILGVFSIPSISHQVVFRHLTYELAKKGHKLVVITPDPGFIKDEIGKNITEIDVHDLSYNLWQKSFIANINGTLSYYDMFTMIATLLPDLVESQLKHKEVQEMIARNEKFDLILIEACIQSALIISYIFKAPVIQVSSLGSVFPNLDVIGAPAYPTLYPEMVTDKIHNTYFWEDIDTLWLDFKIRWFWKLQTVSDNEMFKRLCGPDAPTVTELEKNVEMLFLNTYPIWDGNRPIPPGLIYIGGIYKRPDEKIPEDITNYLNSSTRGVIYMSLGTNVEPSSLPSNVVKIFMNVFSELPHDVLLKWNKDTLPGKPKNVRIFKWLPQPNLLKHPNIKLFITQGGLQSTEEAISAAVPLIGLPVFGDQWYNAAKYVHFGIGLKIDMSVMTEELFKKSVLSVINDQSYRENIRKLRSVMLDQPQSAAEQAVWWVEYVLRHGGARHLRTRLADVSWTEYYMIKVVCVLLLAFLILLPLLFVGLRFCVLVIRSIVRIVYKNYKYKVKIA